MIKEESTPYTILMVDDDHEDCLLTQYAWEESGNPNPIHFVHDGTELMDYLYHRGRFTDSMIYPRPSMILLDLHMPKTDGHQVLQEIKKDSAMKNIPVVVVTSSYDDSDTSRTYQLGANACMTKPWDSLEYRRMVNSLSYYWKTIIQPPLYI